MMILVMCCTCSNGKSRNLMWSRSRRDRKAMRRETKAEPALWRVSELFPGQEDYEFRRQKASFFQIRFLPTAPDWRVFTVIQRC